MVKKGFYVFDSKNLKLKFITKKFNQSNISSIRLKLKKIDNISIKYNSNNY